MYRISVNMNENGKGFFAMVIENKIVGQIEVNLAGSELTLFDTIVPVKRDLHSIGSRLLREVVEYARMHELKIITVSRFVQKQFNSHPSLYADVWEKAEEQF